MGTANYRSSVCSVAVTYSAGRREGKDDAATLQVEGRFSSAVQVRGKVTQNGSDHGEVQRTHLWFSKSCFLLRWNDL